MTTRGGRPFFLITIDTEGDNAWLRSRRITTENARCLPRFQALCERYGLLPTYLANYEMVQSPAFVDFGRDVLKREVGEVGMHLHAWNSPPLVSLTGDDRVYHPYLTEYPRPLMREKVRFLTALLEERFARKMVSHRGGRWAFDAPYAQILAAEGYGVDCSVTPHVSWRSMPGDPRGAGGADFERFPSHAYFLDLDDIRRSSAHSTFLEVPMTIRRLFGPLDRALRRLGTRSAPYRAFRRLCEPVRWFRPRPGNLEDMRRTMEGIRRGGGDYVEFMLHSSELMPGGSPTFPTAEAIEQLFRDLESLFAEAASRFQGATLEAFYRHQLTARGGAR